MGINEIFTFVSEERENYFLRWKISGVECQKLEDVPVKNE